LAPLLGLGFCSFSCRRPVLFFVAADHTIDNDVSRDVGRNRDSALSVTALRVGASNVLIIINAEINIQTVPLGHLGPTNDSFVTVIRLSFRATF
jgi:hypothetical protein